jgi:hypothetical protein
MSSNPHNAMSSDSGASSGEDTLRLIAGLPAPAGLEERVHRALREAPRELRGGGRVLAWPQRFRARIASGSALDSNWMRAAAAAAIVFVVVGGGWGVYSRVQPGQAGKVLVMPQLEPSSRGLSGSGAVRTPVTIPGPKVREQETKGPTDRGSLTAKKPVAPKKAVTGQHPAGAPTPLPAVSQ